jgi:hypothetical protein
MTCHITLEIHPKGSGPAFYSIKPRSLAKSLQIEWVQVIFSPYKMVGFGASTNLQHPTFCREVYFAQTFDFYLILAVLVSTSGAQRLHTATANNIKKDTMRLKCSKEIEHYRRFAHNSQNPCKARIPYKMVP